MYIMSSLVKNSFNDEKKSIIIVKQYCGEKIILLSDGTIFDNLFITSTENGAVTHISGVNVESANYATAYNENQECVLISFESLKSKNVDEDVCSNGIYYVYKKD